VTSLIYVERLRSYLPITARGSSGTPYRIFMGALMLADKFLNDNKSFRTQTIAAATGDLFDVQQINQMEATFMSLVRYKLWINCKDLDDFV
ncbi:cyclin domain-containing protein, partial [Dimargaris cristalligena]